MRAFTDDELLGQSGEDQRRPHLAVATRNELIDAIREIVSEHPKPST
jgi:hypothetical protein